MAEKIGFNPEDEFYNDFASPFRDLPGGFADAGHAHSGMLLGDVHSGHRVSYFEPDIHLATSTPNNNETAELQQPVITPTDIFIHPAVPQSQREAA